MSKLLRFPDPIGGGSPSFFCIHASSSTADQQAAATGEERSVVRRLIPSPTGKT